MLTMTKHQAARLRKALHEGRFRKTEQAMERGLVWTKWELPGVANVVVQTTYDLTTRKTREHDYTAHIWPVGLGAGTSEPPARRPVPTNDNGHTNVPHPGEFLWSDYLDPLELPVNEVATALGIHRKTLSAILNGHQRITLDTAIRLAKAFDTPADEWMARQTAWDLANTDTTRIQVERLMPDTDATAVHQASQDIERLKVSAKSGQKGAIQ